MSLRQGTAASTRDARRTRCERSRLISDEARHPPRVAGTPAEQELAASPVETIG
ncbi:MAG: hypothetical protein M1132_00595 [Chloroflexi bacterium]|nr:hypothetical protein [Chloroflexota bacterium]